MLMKIEQYSKDQKSFNFANFKSLIDNIDVAKPVPANDEQALQIRCIDLCLKRFLECDISGISTSVDILKKIKFENLTNIIGSISKLNLPKYDDTVSSISQSSTDKQLADIQTKYKEVDSREMTFLRWFYYLIPGILSGMGPTAKFEQSKKLELDNLVKQESDLIRQRQNSIVSDIFENTPDITTQQQICLLALKTYFDCEFRGRSMDDSKAHWHEVRGVFSLLNVDIKTYLPLIDNGKKIFVHNERNKLGVYDLSYLVCSPRIITAITGVFNKENQSQATKKHSTPVANRDSVESTSALKTCGLFKNGPDNSSGESNEDDYTVRL